MAIAASPKLTAERQLHLVFDADQPQTRVTTNVIPIRPHIVMSPNHPAVAAVSKSVAKTSPTKSAAAAPIELTMRGRRVVALLALIPIVAGMVLFGGKVAQANSAAPAMTTVVVAPGQSLWDIAASVDPSQDPRAVILEIQQLNGLANSEVAAGQQLVVPAK